MALLDFNMRWADAIKDHQAASWQFIIHKNMVETIIDNVRFQYGYRQFMTIEGQISNCQDGNDTPVAGGGPQTSCDDSDGVCWDGYCDSDGSTQYTDVINSWVRRGQSADVFILHSDFIDPLWDKGANGYGVLISGDRVWVHDTNISHSTAIALQYDGDNILLSFNNLFGMDAACADANDDGFCDSDGTTAAPDQLCDGDFFSDGDNPPNDCRQGVTYHSSVHGPVVAGSPPGYAHCSVNSLDDNRGQNGDTGCLAAASGKMYSCIEYHNKTTSNTGIYRNYCESGIWFGNNSGYDKVRIHGNWLHGRIMSGAVPFNTAAADPGQMGRWRNETGDTPQTSLLPNNWTHDAVFSANLLDSDVYPGQLGVSGQAPDMYGNNSRFYDNVVEGSCNISDQTNPDGSTCTNVGGSDYRNGVNTVWGVGNEVGVDTRVGTRTIPTLPGTSFTSWSQIDFIGTPTESAAPYVGPDMPGDPDSRVPCLPARARLEGC